LPAISTTIGGPAVPSARASAVLPTSHETSAPYNAETAGKDRCTTALPLWPPAASRSLSSAVFSSVCSSRISRSSFGKRPTSASIASRSLPAASARIVSMTATVSTVDSTLCPGGVMTRMLN
jgi:hypothetical protein